MESRTDETNVYGSETAIGRKKVSWSSVWAGVLVGIVLLILLNLLGLGVGLGSLDIAEGGNSAEGLGIGAGIWYLLSSLIALFAAGWVSGRLAQTRRLFDGALHGVLSWCVITLASIYFLTTTVGAVIGGAGRLVGNTLQTVGNASSTVIEAAAPEISEQMPDVNFTALRNDGTSQKVIDMLKEANGDPSKIDRNKLVDVTMATTGKNRPEATETADSLMTKYQKVNAEWQSTKQEIKQKATKTADDVAGATSTTFILAFFAFLIGAAAAAFGAKMGTESRANVNFERRAGVVRS